MNLTELKALLGIAVEDISQDAILSLYLESALEAAKSYTTAYDWLLTTPLPGGIRLGIVRWVELSQARKAKSGISSQSIAGMSITYSNSNTVDSDYFREAYSLWFPYRSKGVVFHTAKRKSIVDTGRAIEIYDEGTEVIRIMTGSPTQL
jgi:hypothetical protein